MTAFEYRTWRARQAVAHAEAALALEQARRKMEAAREAGELPIGKYWSANEAHVTVSYLRAVDDGVGLSTAINTARENTRLLVEAIPSYVLGDALRKRRDA